MIIYYSDLTTIPEIMSVVSLIDSKDFHDLMKAKFNLAELGFYFAQSKGNPSYYDSRKFTVHLGIDRQDLPKRDAIEYYFNQVKYHQLLFLVHP